MSEVTKKSKLKKKTKKRQLKQQQQQEQQEQEEQQEQQNKQEQEDQQQEEEQQQQPQKPCKKCYNCLKEDCQLCVGCLKKQFLDPKESCYQKMCSKLPLSLKHRIAPTFPNGWTFAFGDEGQLRLYSPNGNVYSTVERAIKRNETSLKNNVDPEEFYSILGVQKPITCSSKDGTITVDDDDDNDENSVCTTNNNLDSNNDDNKTTSDVGDNNIEKITIARRNASLSRKKVINARVYSKFSNGQWYWGKITGINDRNNGKKGKNNNLSKTNKQLKKRGPLYSILYEDGDHLDNVLERNICTEMQYLYIFEELPPPPPSQPQSTSASASASTSASTSASASASISSEPIVEQHQQILSPILSPPPETTKTTSGDLSPHDLLSYSSLDAGIISNDNLNVNPKKRKNDQIDFLLDDDDGDFAELNGDYNGDEIIEFKEKGKICSGEVSFQQKVESDTAASRGRNSISASGSISSICSGSCSAKTHTEDITEANGDEIIECKEKSNICSGEVSFKPKVEFDTAASRGINNSCVSGSISSLCSGSRSAKIHIEDITAAAAEAVDFSSGCNNNNNNNDNNNNNNNNINNDNNNNNNNNNHNHNRNHDDDENNSEEDNKYKILIKRNYLLMRDNQILKQKLAVSQEEITRLKTAIQALTK